MVHNPTKQIVRTFLFSCVMYKVYNEDFHSLKLVFSKFKPIRNQIISLPLRRAWSRKCLLKSS